MNPQIKERITMIQRGEIPEGYKRTKIGILPEDWELKTLGELGKFFRGRGIPKSSIRAAGLPCITYGEIYTEYDYTVKEVGSFIDNEIAKSSMPIKKGDILFASSGETQEEIGKCVAYVGQKEAFAGGDIVVFRPNNYSSEVLGYLLNHGMVNRQKYRLGQGHSVVHIYADHLKTIVVPVLSKREQKKVGEILSHWVKAIETMEKFIQEKKEQKKGLMQRLLTGEVRLPGFNGKWVRFRLGDLGLFYQPETISQNEFTDAGYPVFGANGFVGYYDEYNHERWQILITCRGSTCGTVNRSLPKSWITGNAMVFNVDQSDIIEKQFAYYLCLNQDFTRIISGSGQPQITREPLCKFQVRIPIDKKEQMKIGEIISAMDKEIELLEKELELLKKQKKGLMQLLLTGIVRVEEVVV